MRYYPIEVAIALSLWGYNVSPLERARRLYDHFHGDCAELVDLVDILQERTGFAATELAFPTAEVYVRHALERYGEEARHRAAVERMPFEDLMAGKQPPVPATGDLPLLYAKTLALVEELESLHEVLRRLPVEDLLRLSVRAQEARDALKASEEAVEENA